MPPTFRSSTAPRRLRSVVLGVMVALVAGAIAAAPASAAPPTAAYYVDCGRSVSGDGSMAKPWNRLQTVNAHAAFQAGDHILFKRGSACAGSLHPAGSGSAHAPITIGAYGPGQALPTINGNGTRSGTGTVQLRNQSHWTIEDLHVTNHGTAAETNAYRSGVLLLDDDGGRLAGVTVRRLQVDAVVSNLTFKWPNDPREFGGISVVSRINHRSDSGFDGLRILRNRVTKVGRTGIVVSNHGFPKTTDHDVRIGYNTVTRARGDSIILRGSMNGRIDHNVSANGADFWPCKQCGQISPETANAAIWPAGSTNTVIEYNEAYGTHGLGGDGEGIDIDVSTNNTIVQYNYVHNNEGGGVLFCGSNNATVRFNVFQNNHAGQITFIASIPAKSSKIYNNTIYSRVGNYAKVVRTFGDPPSKTNRVRGVAFFNNLIYNMDDSGYYVWPTKPTTRTNTYIGVHGIGEPTESGKGWTDPGLRNPGSGALGFGSLSGYHPTTPRDDPKGSAIPVSATKDIFGNTIDPKRPPRGAAAR